MGEILELIMEGIVWSVGDIFADLVSRALARKFRKMRITNSVLAFIAYVIFGAFVGRSTLVWFPHPLVHPSRLHGISLILLPAIAGWVMSLIGSILRRHDRTTVRIESFTYGFAFAFGLQLVRFLFVK
jgi:uncharacterized membrane protein (DUF485 family)